MADADLEGASGGAEPLQRSNDVLNVQSTNDDHGNVVILVLSFRWSVSLV